VEGFTDNVPISTRVFPSNWELSAGRAATVVRIFSQDGVEPARMVAIGYGEYRPKADNSTPKGRSKNRRVVITILADVDKANNNELLLTLSDRATKELTQQVNSPHSGARKLKTGQAKETLQKTKLERGVSTHSVSPNG
jgi:hypothetical protein